MNVSGLLLCSLALGFLLAPTGVPTARADPYTMTDPSLRIHHEGVVCSFMNSDDALIGGSYRYSFLPRYGLGASGAFYLRPYEKDVRCKAGPRLFLQLHERRYAGMLAVDKEQALVGWLALYAGVGVAYTLADFDGTRRTPDEGWTPLTEIGLCFRGIGQKRAVIVRIAHRYMDLRNSEKNWVYVALGVRG